MNILVLLCGIADPKLPLPRDINALALDSLRAAHPLLSPFDEAALELALKLRDADPTVHITAVVPVSSTTDPLLRTVASLRLDQTFGLDIQHIPSWNSLGVAHACAAAVSTLDPLPSLVLIGREFGDCDDGTTTACIAQALGMAYSKLVFSIAIENVHIHAVRQNGARQERVRLPLPAVASVTNDARSKLRHPLLKNVMVAKKMTFKMIDLSEPIPGNVQLTALAAAPVRTRATTCRMLPGNAQMQANVLAELLLAHGSAR
ncbi:hypothetical protein [Polaromonas hydrogenivorans]|uniref:Electron transfer flavoprotein alpha/beta-subunit N-terminal domain-containing protein n=1 Tax=Polaromonas hydrogenivorans TaxID=335476 RepID=A0AAU7LXK9_9BURK